MNKISLDQLQTDKKALVVEIAGTAAFQNKLMAMGIYPGREIIKLSHFIFRGPVAVKVGRTTVALGHGMASRIMVRLK